MKPCLSLSVLSYRVIKSKSPPYAKSLTTCSKYPSSGRHVFTFQINPSFLTIGKELSLKPTQPIFFFLSLRKQGM